ncbi:MAG: hypothetical protein ACYCZX_16105, partial [Rhodospirillaceae bacterium]
MASKSIVTIFSVLFAGAALTGCADTMGRHHRMGGDQQAGCKMAGGKMADGKMGKNAMDKDKKQMMAKMDCPMMDGKKMGPMG